jgi:hypothetical protein
MESTSNDAPYFMIIPVILTKLLEKAAARNGPMKNEPPELAR